MCVTPRRACQSDFILNAPGQAQKQKHNSNDFVLLNWNVIQVTGVYYGGALRNKDKPDAFVKLTLVFFFCWCSFVKSTITDSPEVAVWNTNMGVCILSALTGKDPIGPVQPCCYCCFHLAAYGMLISRALQIQLKAITQSTQEQNHIVIKCHEACGIINRLSVSGRAVQNPNEISINSYQDGNVPYHYLHKNCIYKFAHVH